MLMTLTNLIKNIHVKLSEEEKYNIVGPISEYECTIALNGRKTTTKVWVQME